MEKSNPSTTVPAERKENPHTQKAPPCRPGRTSGSKLPVATHTHTRQVSWTLLFSGRNNLEGNETPNLNVTFDHFGIVEESDGALALVIHVALAGELEHFSDCWTAGVDDKAPEDTTSTNSLCDDDKTQFAPVKFCWLLFASEQVGRRSMPTKKTRIIQGAKQHNPKQKRKCNGNQTGKNTHRPHTHTHTRRTQPKKKTGAPHTEHTTRALSTVHRVDDRTTTQSAMCDGLGLRNRLARTRRSRTTNARRWPTADGGWVGGPATTLLPYLRSFAQL